jgi:general secretion pathway protein D
MKTTPLVLILFLTACGLWAQTPTTGLTPAQSNLLQMRLRALTNRPALTPAETSANPAAATPAASAARPGFPAPQAGTPGPAAPAPTPTVPAITPAAPATTPAVPAAQPAVPTTTPAAPTTASGKETPGYTYNWPGVDVNQVLSVYADLVGRTLLRAQVPQASIMLKTQSPLTKTEAIEALQAVLALNGITVINIGDKFVKVLSPQDAGASGAEFNDVPANQLPDLGTYVTHIVQLKYLKPSAVVPVITPLAKLKDLIPLDDNGILVMRDYAENVKRMLEMIAKVDVSVPAEYISEVIPIRYAQADDIASALNSLGGQGGATVSVGSSGPTQPISGLANRPISGALGGAGQTGVNPASPFGQNPGMTPNPTGTPSSATPFQRRLLNIINAAGGGQQQPIQIFGQAKIIADERSNSLLIFATRQDMEAIKHVISQLDVVLAQVLIESVIIDYSLGPNTVNFGVSAAQSPQGYSSNPQTVGAGGINNGQSFLNLISLLNGSSTLTNSAFGNNLGGGLSYFGNIGPRWDVALQAVASDSHASIIQQPRILTQQAKPAQFFVGDTVPYVTSTYNYGGAYGNQSSYSQLSVGVELDVTPFINPDGLVVMQIEQEIDDLNGYTTITGVGQIPNTIKRTLHSEIAVRNKDTVMLGGFIKNSKSTSRQGVPVLQDIPLLGGLFSSHSNSKQREELIVLMRPTVLETPELAAVNTVTEERRLPGVSQSYGEYVNEQNKTVEAEQRYELRHPRTMSGGFFNAPGPTNAPAEKLPPPSAGSESFFSPVPPNAPAVPANNNNNNVVPPRP